MITSPVLKTFLDLTSSVPGTPRRVLEMGSRRWGDHPTVRRTEVLEGVPGSEFVGTDFQPGDDVDVVCDAHQLSGAFPADHFAGVLCENVLEHCRRPWVVAEQIVKVVRPGGFVLAGVPQAFPVHGYPDDYWRATPGGLEVLFEPWCDTVVKGHHVPALVVPRHNQIREHGPWNYEGEAWLMSYGLFRRRA